LPRHKSLSFCGLLVIVVRKNVITKELSPNMSKQRSYTPPDT
jgi:hypothetical protein